LNSIRAITFDAGGTLLHPHPSVGAIYAEAMQRHGLTLDADMLETAFRRVFKAGRRAPRETINETSEKEWWKSIVWQVLDEATHRNAPGNSVKESPLPTPLEKWRERDIPTFSRMLECSASPSEGGEKRGGDFESLFNDLWHTFAEPRRWRLDAGARETLVELKKRGYRLAILSNWDLRLRSLLEGLRLAPYFEHLIISSEAGFEKPDPRIFELAQHRFGLSPHEILHVGDSEHHDAEGARKVGWRWVIVQHHERIQPSTSGITRLTDLLEIYPAS